MSFEPDEYVFDRGFVMLELLVAVVVLSFGIIPLYYVFTTSKATVFRSEMSYVALVAARERLDELRLLPVEVLANMAQNGETPWQPVRGNAFGMLLSATASRTDKAPMKNASGSVSALPEPSLNGAGFDYPKYYERIKLKTSIQWLLPLSQNTVGQAGEPVKPPFLFKAVVKVRWQEKGESVQAQAATRPKTFVSKLETVFSVGGFGEGRAR